MRSGCCAGQRAVIGKADRSGTGIPRSDRTPAMGALAAQRNACRAHHTRCVVWSQVTVGSTMLHHVSLGTNDLARARAFYDPVLAVVGLRLLGLHQSLTYALGGFMTSLTRPV